MFPDIEKKYKDVLFSLIVDYTLRIKVEMIKLF
jgi:hypothetical protein